VLEALGTSYVRIGLSHTDFWHRLIDGEVRRAFGELGGATVLEHVVSTLADRNVRAGVVHGDLHLGNLLVGRDRPVLIDWDYFDRRSPQFIDALAAVNALVPHRRDAFGTLIPRLRTIAAGSAELPLRPHVFGRDDELSVPEMVVCFILWRITRPMRYLGAHVPAPDRAKHQHSLAFCRQLLGL
jgi:hypothetical protein